MPMQNKFQGVNMIDKVRKTISTKWITLAYIRKIFGPHLNEKIKEFEFIILKLTLHVQGGISSNFQFIISIGNFWLIYIDMCLY